MAVRFIEGFDSYPTIAGVLGVESRWIVTATGSFSLTGGRFGGQGVRNSGSAAMSAALGGSPDVAGTVGLAYQVVVSPAALSRILTLRDSNDDVQATLAMDQLGRVFVYRGNLTTFLAQADVTLTVGVWYYIEVEFSIDNGAGFLRVFVNGSRVINFVGNTQGVSGVNTVSRIGLFNTTGAHAAAYDDVYGLSVASRLGECRVEPLRPNNDTATKNFTPNAGTENYTRVNEVLTDGDTSYVYSSLVGAEDLYEVGNLSVTPQNIFAVQTRIVARKDDVATRVLKASLKSGAAATVYGSDFFLASSYTTKVDIYEQDPNTAAAWTKAGVDAIQIGQKITV